VNVHRFAEIRDDLFGAQTARFFLVRVAAFPVQQFLVLNGDASAANPVGALAGVNVVEIGQDSRLCSVHKPEYQIGCGALRRLVN